MSLFFTADTHFGHTNLTRAGNAPDKARPFDTVEEHDERLVKQWNTVVGPRDTVYHLGDVCWGTRKDRYAILGRLNGKIHLIRGNHDRDIKAMGSVGNPAAPSRRSRSARTLSSPASASRPSRTS